MLNKVLLRGRLTKDVEVRNTQGGKMVVSASLATNKKWKDQNGQPQERVEFHNLVVWNGAEAFAKYLRKGSKVYIEGELQTDSWTDQQSGQKKYATKINVREFVFLDNKPQDQGNQNQTNDTQNDNPFENGEVSSDGEINIYDIPF